MIIVTVTNKTAMLPDESFLYIIFNIEYEQDDTILPMINEILTHVYNTLYINNSLYVPEFYKENVVNILERYSCKVI